ncbi:MAG: LytTR family DNA-binding domain-containing protein [Massilia sp.]
MPIAVIVEDEPLLRAELRDQLHALWPELEIGAEADNGIEAVAHIESLRPDVVFLDIQVQVHRAAIVNLQAIDHIARDGTAMEILLKGRTEKLAVSEAYGRQFRQM